MNDQVYKILIIDDSPEDCAVFRDFLQKDKDFNYSFIEEELGEAGVAICLKELPDCVLLDYNLPDTDGLAVIRQLNPDPLNPVFPVILMTGEGSEKLAVKAIKNGAQDYLVKGKISAEELRLTVHNAIEIVSLRGSHKKHEQDLQASESRYRSLFELAAVGIAQADGATGHFQEVNDKFCRITGYSREELLALEFPDLTHPDDREADRENRRKLAHGKENQAEYIKRYVRKDGQTIWVKVTATIIRNEAGKVEYGVSIVEDITAGKQAEAVLRETEQRRRLALEAGKMGTWEWLADSGMMNFDEYTAEIFGFNSDQLSIGDQKVFRIVEEADVSQLKQIFQKSLETGENCTAEFRIKQSNGGTRWIYSTGRPILDENSKAKRMVGVHFDITERKQAEENQRKSEERLKLGVEVADFAICEIDYTNNTNCLSKEAAKIYGFGDQEITVPRKTVHAVFHPDDAPKLAPIIAESLNPDGAGWFASEHRIVLKNGDVRWLSVRKQIFFDRTQNPPRPSHGILVAQDITERKRAEEIIRVNEERLNLLHSVVANPNLSDTARLQSLLELGCRQFGLENGIVGEITDDVYRVALAVSPGDAIAVGFICPVGDAFCDEVLKRKDLLAIENVGGSEWREHRAHSVFGTEVYFGSPINVGGSVFGTLCFTSATPRTQKFTNGDQEFLRLLAQTVGTEMTRQHFTAKLHENQRFTNSIIETAPSVLYTFNLKTGSPVYLTDQAATVLGYSFAEVKDGQADFLQSYMHPDDANLAQKHFQQFTKTSNGNVFEFEYRMRHKSGEWRWFRSRDRVFKRDENGSAEEILGIAFDITEIKQTAAVNEQQARLINLSYEPIFVWTADDGILEWNAGAEQLYGYTKQEAVGKISHELLKTIHPLPLEKLLTALEHDGEWTGEVRHTAKDGYEVIIESRYQVIEIDGRQMILETNRDITESKQAEEKLRESEEHFRSLFNSIDEGFCIIEMIFDENNKPIDYRFVQANPALERLTGLKDALGKTMREFVPDLEEFWFETYGKVALTGEPARFENEAVPMNRWFEVYASRVGNSTSRVAVVFNNITERKNAEIERERLLEREKDLRREAEFTNRAKEEFLAILSHELRTPLNSIYGWTQILESSGFDRAKTKLGIEVIGRNVRLQNALIEDLLDVSRIISGKMRLEKESLSLFAVVYGAVEAIRPAAEQKSVKIEDNLDAEIGETDGDKFRIQQIFNNLLTNAVKFTPDGGTVSITLERDGETAKFSVRDTGIGIPSELLPHIFDRFRQADASSKRQFGGLGLGLTIVKNLVELHGGTISVYSDGENSGAIFTVELPLIAQIELPALPPPSIVEAKTLDGKRILVVDDELDALELMRFVLTQNGAEVTCVNSAKKALQESEANEFDLLISDLGMPEMDGYDLIREVRQSSKDYQKNLPAIALTGYVSADDRERVMLAGFQIHLPKPIDIEKLSATAQKLTQKSEK